VNNSGETSNAGATAGGAGGIGAGGGAAGKKRLAFVNSPCRSGAGGGGLVLLAWTEGY
jgi:hypothetical protein